MSHTVGSQIEILDQVASDIAEVLQPVFDQSVAESISYYDPHEFYRLWGKDLTGDAIAVMSYDGTNMYHWLTDSPTTRDRFLTQLGKIYEYDQIDDAAILIIEKIA